LFPRLYQRHGDGNDGNDNNTNGIVVVIVETPETDAKDLEDVKRVEHFVNKELPVAFNFNVNQIRTVDSSPGNVPEQIIRNENE